MGRCSGLGQVQFLLHLNFFKGEVMCSPIIVRRIFIGSKIFIAYREDNEDIEGFGQSAQEAYNDLVSIEKGVS